MSIVSPARRACDRETTPDWIRARLRRVEGSSLSMLHSVEPGTDNPLRSLKTVVDRCSVVEMGHYSPSDRPRSTNPPRKSRLHLAAARRKRQVWLKRTVGAGTRIGGALDGPA